jgi:aspartyl-tRNA(Asn)/glutamyl-tRNA(Gln) amidotransferase subunit A
MPIRRRIPERALRPIVAVLRTKPGKQLVSQLLRSELGVTALRSLGDESRSPLPFAALPIAARRERSRASSHLGPPVPPAWPPTSRTIQHAVRTGKLTAEQVAERALDAARNLAAHRLSLGPLVDTDPVRALSAARLSTARLRSGSQLGPFDGVPTAIKEEVNVLGMATRMGTGWLPQRPAHADAAAVDRLRAQGAVVLGQTSMTEYGLSPLGANAHREMPRNPHNMSHLAGGSSTGSAVGVSTGVFCVALGVDGGGSIRVPASHCGVFGLKPTFGRIPLSGHGTGGGGSMLHIGPIAASCYDIAAFVEIAAGPDGVDAACEAAPKLETGELVQALGRGVRGLSIGVVESQWSAASKEVTDPGRESLKALEQAGARLVPVEIPGVAHAPALGYLTLGLEFFSGFSTGARQHLSELGPDVQLVILALGACEPDDYLDAQCIREKLRRDTAAVLRSVDVLALPTTADIAPEASDSGTFFDPQALDAACRFAFLANLTGLPAGTAPVGRAQNGLPLGLQIVGDAWDEATVLQVLAELERCGAARVVRPPSGVDVLADT